MITEIGIKSKRNYLSKYKHLLLKQLRRKKGANISPVHRADLAIEGLHRWRVFVPLETNLGCTCASDLVNAHSQINNSLL